jgi:preprotein translocase subunit SecE
MSRSNIVLRYFLLVLMLFLLVLLVLNLVDWGVVALIAGYCILLAL